MIAHSVFPLINSVKNQTFVVFQNSLFLSQILACESAIVSINVDDKRSLDHNRKGKTMGDNVYCEYCGHKANSVNLLTSNSCGRHPSGSNRGKHKLYEGGEKSEYVCKYCGRSAHTISELVSNSCGRHPDGSNKGKHAPAL